MNLPGRSDEDVQSMCWLVGKQVQIILESYYYPTNYLVVNDDDQTVFPLTSAAP